MSGTAIECMLDEIRLTITLQHATKIAGPRVLTAPDERGARRWVTLGLGATLDEAAAMATAGMLDVM